MLNRSVFKGVIESSRDRAELSNSGRVEHALHHEHTVQIELKRLVSVHVVQVSSQTALAARLHGRGRVGFVQGGANRRT